MARPLVTEQSWPIRGIGRRRMGIFWMVMAVAILGTIPTIDGPAWWVILVFLIGGALSAIYGRAEWRAGRMTGEALRLEPDAIVIMMAYGGPFRIGWDEVEGLFYWEPMGLDKLVKARAPHWIGIRPRDQAAVMARMTPDQRIAAGLNRLMGRPALALVATDVDAMLPAVMHELVEARPDLFDPKGAV